MKYKTIHPQPGAKEEQPQTFDGFVVYKSKLNKMSLAELDKEEADPLLLVKNKLIDIAINENKALLMDYLVIAGQLAAHDNFNALQGFKT